MPSPFPGMDPYLEGPRLWPDVHHSLISSIRQQLNPRLRPKYVARIEERVYISDETDPGRRGIIPDVLLVATPEAAGRRPAEPYAPTPDGGADVAQAVEVVELINQEIHEARIEVRDVIDRSVVTVIEVLSPTNKIRGAVGRREYVKKRRKVMASAANLVEIDLLRTGAPIFAGQPLPPHDYGAYVSRVADESRKGLFWPIMLNQRLPRVPVPLRQGDPDVELDLQMVFDAAYDQAEYDADIDYHDEPDVRLPELAARWSDELLKSKGLR
jgi:hypothetical protein